MSKFPYKKEKPHWCFLLVVVVFLTVNLINKTYFKEEIVREPFSLLGIAMFI